MKKYALYIGRWQNWHKGHEWLINQQLNQGKNVWVAIINYGRGVGYDVIYHEPPADVAVISGTAIRTGHMTPDGTITYDETKG